VVMVLVAIACLGYNFNITMPLMAQDAFGAGADAFGLLMAAIGLGSVIAALAVATIGRSDLRLLLVAGVAFSAFELATAFAPWLALACVLLIGLGYAGMIFTSSAQSHLQLAAPDHMRGRVMSVYSLVFTGVTPMGAILTGYLADALHIRAALGLEAALCLVITLIGVMLWRRQPAAFSPQLVPQPVVSDG